MGYRAGDGGKSGRRGTTLAERYHEFMVKPGMRREIDARDTTADETWAVFDLMATLAERFPCLIGKPGVRPWDPDRLERWADENPVTGPELCSARFVLHVWDGERAWGCGRFDLLVALDCWDGAHRAAFASWALDPWWPLSLRVKRSSVPPMPSRDTLPPSERDAAVDSSPHSRH